MRYHPAYKSWARARVAGALVVLLIGCGPNPQKTADAPVSRPGAITLSAQQLLAIRIGPVGDYRFPIERKAVGSIAFSDELSEIQAESTLLGAAATYALTRKELTRVRALGTGNGIAQKELEQATSDEQTAEAQLKAARDAVRAIGKTDAEIDAMISKGRIESHPSAHPSIKWATAYVAESDSALCSAGDAVEVRVPAASARVFEGALTEVYAAVDPSLHRVFVRASINDPEGLLRPGMLADVAIEVQRPDVSIGIPESAVVREGDGTMTVWTTSDRRHFVQRVVTTGLREGGRIQILRGLRIGEQVVTDGAIFLDNMLNAAPSDD